MRALCIRSGSRRCSPSCRSCFINVLAFAVAYALTQGIKGSNLYRTVFFMPNLIGGIVLGYIWSMIFDGILSRYGTSILLNSKYGFWGSSS